MQVGSASLRTTEAKGPGYRTKSAIPGARQKPFWKDKLDNRAYSPNMTMCMKRGPCAPRMFCASMSAVPLVPVMKFVERGGVVSEIGRAHV